MSVLSKPKRSFDPQVDDLHWQILFDLHMKDMQSLDAISSIWLENLEVLKIDNSKLLTAAQLTEAIAPHTGYTFVQTQDHIIHPQRQWYGMIADYQMPLSCFLRKVDELAYCDEPDIWHDIMGHIPFLADQAYSDMYQLLATTYIKAYDTQRSDLLRQLDFIGGMLIELGLIREDGNIRAFGATFYSSSEVFEAFKPQNQRTFTIEDLNSGESYNRHSFQGKYYILESLDQLVEVINSINGSL